MKGLGEAGDIARDVGRRWCFHVSELGSLEGSLFALQYLMLLGQRERGSTPDLLAYH